MANALEVLRKENNRQNKLFWKENNATLADIVVYLRSSNLSEYSIETIRKELGGMALESQLRNEKFSDVVGEDCKAFCDELIKNGTQKTGYDKILENSQIFFQGIGFLFFIELIFTSTIINIVTKGNFMMPISLGFVISAGCIIILAYATYWYITKRSFELSGKNRLANRTVFIIAFSLLSTAVVFIKVIFNKTTLFSVNCLFPLLFFIIGIFAFKLLQTNNINKNINN